MSEIKKATEDILNMQWGVGNVRTPKQEIDSTCEQVMDLIDKLLAITPPDDGTTMFIEHAVHNLRTTREVLLRASGRLK